MTTLACGFLIHPKAKLHWFIDAHSRISISALNRAGALIPGTTTEWAWPTGVATAPGRVKVSAELGRVLLAFDDGPPQAVGIEWQPATTGGEFPLFVCACGKRRWHLFAREGTAGCRACLQLEYRSRHELRWSPRLRRIAQLRAELAVLESEVLSRALGGTIRALEKADGRKRQRRSHR